MHEYGKTNWESLWEKLEQTGNVGIDHVINPSLYPRILNFLSQHPKSVVVDFGCGTNLMGIQLLFGYTDSIPALKNNPEVDHARFNTLLYVGIEGSQELVDQSNRYLHDIGTPKNIATVQCHIDKELHIFDADSIDLCVSRNFLMHLPAEDFSAHMQYVAHILKPQSYYICTTLNPAYELKKVSHEMTNGERYDFAHGKEGEYGTFYHFYKTPEFIQKTIETYFEIESVEPCVPTSDAFKETHARYYDAEPMALTYVLRVK
jgi:SAM-dependent methyltransferase